MLVFNVKPLNMLCVKQTFFWVVVLFTTIPVFAQTQHVQIEWNKSNALFNGEGKTVAMPTFKNAIHAPAKNFIPTYLTSLPILGESIHGISITNEQYLPLSTFTGNKDSLPSSIVPNTSVSTVKKKNFATISFTPIRLSTR